MFTQVPQLEPSSSTVATLETEGPPQIDTERETERTTTSTFVPEVLPTCPSSIVIIYVSAELIQALVQRQVGTESRLIQLL